MHRMQRVSRLPRANKQHRPQHPFQKPTKILRSPKRYRQFLNRHARAFTRRPHLRHRPLIVHRCRKMVAAFRAQPNAPRRAQIPRRRHNQPLQLIQIPLVIRPNRQPQHPIARRHPKRRLAHLHIHNRAADKPLKQRLISLNLLNLPNQTRNRISRVNPIFRLARVRRLAIKKQTQPLRR